MTGSSVRTVVLKNVSSFPLGRILLPVLNAAAPHIASKMHCVISKRAQAVIEIELSRFPDTETGGLLLGYSEPENGVLILEATDSGYQDVIHEVGCFQYDIAYEEHLCSFLSQLYQPSLQLVGVWHKHNSVHSDNTIPFSSADENMHHQLMENDCPCVSILFEKSNAYNDNVWYKVSVFLLSTNGEHQNVTDSTIWGKPLCNESISKTHEITIDSQSIKSR